MLRFYVCCADQAFWGMHRFELELLVDVPLRITVEPCTYHTTNAADVRKHIWDRHLRGPQQPDYRQLKRKHIRVSKEIDRLIQLYSETYGLERQEEWVLKKLP